MVLLILAAIWAAVLIPPALRRRAAGRPGDSIHAFQGQLSTLRRTAPRGHRLGMGDHWSRPSTPLAPPLAPLGRPHIGPTHVGPTHVPGGSRTVVTPPAWAGMRAPAAVVPSSRTRTLRRRREILTALAVAAVASLVLGALPFLRMLWAAHVVFDVLLVAYVALLIRQRNVAAEREMKVRFLPGATFDPAIVRQEPVLLRRTAAN